MVKLEGAAGLYKGISASVLYGVPYAGAQLTFYPKFQELFWEMLGREGRELHESCPPYFPHHLSRCYSVAAASLPVKLVSGACAGVSAQSLVYPLYLIRTRLQSDGVGGKVT